LLVGLASVGGVGLVGCARGVDLFVLRCDVEAGDPYELQLLLLDFGIVVQVAVGEVTSQLPRLLLETQLVADFHGPVEQDAAVVPLDIGVTVQSVVLQQRLLEALAIDQAVHRLALHHEGPHLLA